MCKWGILMSSSDLINSHLIYLIINFISLFLKIFYYIFSSQKRRKKWYIRGCKYPGYCSILGRRVAYLASGTIRFLYRDMTWV